MTEKLIIKKAHEYIDTQLKNNPEWLSYITDCWIYDAEDWFAGYLKKRGIQIYTNDEDYDYTPEADMIYDVFRDESFKYMKELNIKINGVRDGLGYLNACLYDIKRAKESYSNAMENLTPHFIGEPTIGNEWPKVPEAYFDIPLREIEGLIQNIELLQKKIKWAMERDNEKK